MIPRLSCAALLACVAAFPSVAQEQPRTDLDERAMALFDASYRDYCNTVGYAGELPAERMENFEFSYSPSSDAEAGEKSVLVYRFLCAYGSYYMEHVYFWWREPYGLQPLMFSVPSFDANFENDDDVAGKLLSIDVTGFSAQASLINSEIDVEAGTTSNTAMWRGLGDAGSHGTWVLSDGEFRLTRFDVDPSYDNNENPVTVVEYPKP
jgi:hypothetical protein